jgi:hypothetical protein
VGRHRGGEGHWIEVRPAVDPADDIGVAEKRYILALPPDDEALAGWAARGWLRVLGGGRWSAVIRFTVRPTPAEAVAAVRAAWVRDGGWIAATCERNEFGDPVQLFADPAEVPRRAAVRGECRRRMARLQVVTLLSTYAIEPTDPAFARRVRSGALALGWLSSLVGDEATLDFRSATAHARFREDMAAVSRRGHRRRSRPADRRPARAFPGRCARKSLLARRQHGSRASRTSSAGARHRLASQAGAR